MIEISVRKILKNLTYIIFLSIPFYYVLRDYFEISSDIFTIILIASFACCLILNLKENEKNYFLIIELLIATNIFLLFIFLGYSDRALILLFVAIIISKCIFIAPNYYFLHAANALVISSIIGSVGIILGLLEVYFGKSQILYQVMSFDYPYSDGKNPTILINGFFASANGSAYCIGAGLAFIKYQSIFLSFGKKILYIIFIISLAITKAKFVFLIFVSLFLVLIARKYSKNFLLISLLILGSCYIFLSHIIVAFEGSYDYPSVHFRKILLSIEELNLVLGNYGLYKLYSFEAFKGNLLIPLGLENFEILYGARPHFMIGSLIIYGGVTIAILIIFYIYFLLKDNIKNLFNNIDTNIIYFCVLFAFLIETINWDFGNNFYFWSVIFSTHSVLIKKSNL